MIHFWNTLGWLWSKRAFFAMSLLSAVLFFAWFFPFSDLSDVVTSIVAKSTNNQIYIQFESLSLNLLPVPAVSARNVSVETAALPPLHAKWLKISPSWLNILFNVWTLKKASSGDAEAAAKLSTRLGANIAAEGMLGADVDLRLRPGSAGDTGAERSKVTLAVEKLNLSEVQKWGDLSFKLTGQANLDGTLIFAPGFAEQPEGEVDLRVSKFNMPAATVNVPYEGAVLPVSLPAVTLANVVLRGHLTGGRLTIDEGTFGNSKDPISGRIKGTMSVKFLPAGQNLQTQFGPYNLTVDLNVSNAVEKEIGIAFLLFQSAKTATPTGSHYLFTASGQSFGPAPQVTRIGNF